MPAELRPDAPEPIETAPGASLESAARRAMDAVQAEVIHCYELALVRDASTAGRIEVQLDLRSDGGVSRVHLDHQGAGIDAIAPCLRDLFATLHVRDVAPRGRYVTRIYTFANPPIDRILANAVVVTPPPRPPRAARARARRGAPPPMPEPVSAAPQPPRPGPGSMRAEEIARGLTDVPTLRACATLVLRRARRPSGSPTLRMTIGGDGGVSEVRVEATPPLAADATRCVTDAVGALQYRGSGITVRAQVPLRFQR